MKNILFVDDDEPLLDGLKRSLRSKRREWNMIFSTDPIKALKLFKEEEIDVVVSDMRMPSMYGSTFLEMISQQYPNTIRFILSGQSDEYAMLKSLRPSHQYLSKPCPPEVLQEKIELVLKAQSYIENVELKTAITQIKSLPTLPTLYTQLMNELESDDYTLISISEIIEQDISMSAQIIKVVNSSYFGVKRQITTVRDAVSLLGIDYIKSIVLVSKLFETKDLNLPSWFVKGVYEEGVKVSSLVKRLAENDGLSKDLISSCFLASMLQSVGLLIVGQLYPDLLEDFTKLDASDLPKIIEKENERFQTTHHVVSAFLLCLWGMDSKLCDGIAFSENPINAEDITNEILLYLHVANTIYIKETLDTKFLDERGIRSEKVEEWHLVAKQFFEEEV